MTSICGSRPRVWKTQLAGEVAGQTVRHGLVPQQGAVLLLHREGVRRTDDHAEGDERAEDARQGHGREQQVGPLHLGVAAQEQVAEHQEAVNR